MTMRGRHQSRLPTISIITCSCRGAKSCSPREPCPAWAQHQAEIDNSGPTILVLRDDQNGGCPGPGMPQFVEQTAPTLLHDPLFIIGDDTKASCHLYNPYHVIDVYQVLAPGGNIAVVSSTPSANFNRIERFIKPKARP